MKFSDLVKVAAVGALVYGAYKLGEKQAQKKSNLPKDELQPEEIEEVEIVEVDGEKSEKETIEELIKNLKSKPNKTAKDKNTIELLEIKLKQLIKGK